MPTFKKLILLLEHPHISLCQSLSKLDSRLIDGNYKDWHTFRCLRPTSPNEISLPINTRKGWSFISCPSSTQVVWNKTFETNERNQLHPMYYMTRRNYKTAPIHTNTQEERTVSIHCFIFILFSRHFELKRIAKYAFLTSWLFSTFT